MASALGVDVSLVRVYIAVSVDGYIADVDGGVAWLDPYFTEEIDFHEFTSTIGATVMGRRTFDQAVGFEQWHPPSPHTVVLTHHPVEPARPGVEAFGGDVHELTDRLRHEVAVEGKDIWLMGGGETIRMFQQSGLVDRWELFVIPVLLGAGVRLFPGGAPEEMALTPTRSKTYANGIVELWYEPLEEEAS